MSMKNMMKVVGMKTCDEMSDEELKELDTMTDNEINEWHAFRNQIQAEQEKRKKANCTEHDFRACVDLPCSEGWHDVSWWPSQTEGKPSHWVETCDARSEDNCGNSFYTEDNIPSHFVSVCRKCQFTEPGVANAVKEEYS